MNGFAFLRWRWQAQSAVHTGMSGTLAEFSGNKAVGGKSNINLIVHGDSGGLEPAILASSVKGVFRSTAAWLVERAARELGETRYVTCDYNSALEEGAQNDVRRDLGNRFCPITLVFGGLTCPQDTRAAGDESRLRRRQSRVHFFFDNANDAQYGSVADGPQYHFMWEKASKKYIKALRIEEFTARDAPVRLVIRLDDPDAFALALLWLTGDLISSGAFRVGKFTSRGLGFVHLAPEAYCQGSLDAWLSDAPVAETALTAGSGFAAAQAVLGRNPTEIVQAHVGTWLKG